MNILNRPLHDILYRSVFSNWRVSLNPHIRYWLERSDRPCWHFSMRYFLTSFVVHYHGFKLTAARTSIIGLLIYLLNLLIYSIWPLSDNVNWLLWVCILSINNRFMRCIFNILRVLKFLHQNTKLKLMLNKKWTRRYRLHFRVL